MKNIVAGAALLLTLSSCEIKVGSKVNKEIMSQEETKETLDFPLESTFSKEYLLQNFWKCNYDSAGEPLAYWVVLPKNVKPTKIEPELLKNVGLTSIGGYQTIDKSDYMEVDLGYETLATPIQPSTWLKEKLKVMGDKVLNQNIVRTKDNEEYLDVLTRRTLKNGDHIISRLNVMKSGLNYFVIRVSCDEKVYKNLAQTIFHTSTTWSPKSSS
jgi:hypothetical protein